MKQINLLAATLVGLGALSGAPAQALSVPFNSLLTRGQGYNTFLGKGAKHGAVDVVQNGKRAFVGQPQDEQHMPFTFTPPAADISGLDPAQYFTPPDADEIDQIIAAYSGEDNAINTRDLSVRVATANCPGDLQVETKMITSYEKYLKALDISASATISGWGQSASMSGKYLDKSEFSTNSLIYLAKLEVAKQQNPDDKFIFNNKIYNNATFDQDFGDRWIRGFETGGKMIARVVVTAKEKSSSQDIQANVDASLKFWGVSADINASMKKSMEELSKQAEVKVSLFYQGDLGTIQEKAGSPETISSTSAEDAFRQVKSWSDKFLGNACTHEYKYRALLDEYTTLENFPSGQKVIQYRVAELVAYLVLKELAKLSEMSQVLQGVASLADSKKQEIQLAYLGLVEESQEWTETVAKTPAIVKEASDALLAKYEAFISKYKPDLPVATTGECGIQGGNKKCPKAYECCSSGGECGTSLAHCGYSYGKYCQEGFGDCFVRDAKEGQTCGRAKDADIKACIDGLCCSEEGKCTTKYSMGFMFNLGNCPSKKRSVPRRSY